MTAHSIDDDASGAYLDDDDCRSLTSQPCSDQAWPASYFRNRQQFGAHCSNCSRRRNVGPPEGVLRLSGALPLPPKKKAPAPKPKRPAESESDLSPDDEESDTDRRPIKRSHSDSLRLLQENATQLLRQDDGERERLHSEVETLSRELEEKRQRTVDELRALRVDFKRELSQLAGHAETKLKNIEDLRARDEESHYEGVYLEIEQLKSSLQSAMDSCPAADPKWTATATELERRVEALLKKISMLSTAVPQSPVSNSSISPPHSPAHHAPAATSAQLQDMKTALLEEVSTRMDALFKALETKRNAILKGIAAQREQVLSVANYVSMFSPNGPRPLGASPAATPSTTRNIATEPVNTSAPM